MTSYVHQPAMMSTEYCTAELYGCPVASLSHSPYRCCCRSPAAVIRPRQPISVRSTADYCDGFAVAVRGSTLPGRPSPPRYN